MAIRDDFFEALENGAKWDVGVSINRSNPLPLDSNSVFKSYSDAETYAAGVLAYPGQVIAVVDVDKTTCYVLDGNKALQPVGSASSTTQVVASQEEMLALTDIEKGQMVYRTDTKTTWVFIGEDPSSLDDWSESASTNDTVWQGTENKVGFYALDKSTYDGLESKDSSVLYFLTDTGKIFKGETDVTQAVAAVTDFGEATDAALNKIYLNTSTLEIRIRNNDSWLTIMPGFVTDGANWAAGTDDTKLATIGAIKTGITETINSAIANKLDKLGSGTADVVIVATADGGIQRSVYTVGGATLSGTADATKLATEAAVESALSWSSISA